MVKELGFVTFLFAGILLLLLVTRKNNGLDGSKNTALFMVLSLITVLVGYALFDYFGCNDNNLYDLLVFL